MKLSKKIKEWYLENKESAISTIIGSTSLLLAITSTYKAIDDKIETNKIRQNPYVTEYIRTDVQLKELKDELRLNKGYYLIHNNKIKPAKKIEDSLENKLYMLENNNRIVQEYSEKARPSKKSFTTGKNGFYYYHKGSKESESAKYWAFSLYVITGLSCFAKIMSKTLDVKN